MTPPFDYLTTVVGLLLTSTVLVSGAPVWENRDTVANSLKDSLDQETQALKESLDSLVQEMLTRKERVEQASTQADQGRDNELASLQSAIEKRIEMDTKSHLFSQSQNVPRAETNVESDELDKLTVSEEALIQSFVRHIIKLWSLRAQQQSHILERQNDDTGGQSLRKGEQAETNGLPKFHDPGFFKLWSQRAQQQSHIQNYNVGGGRAG